MSECGMYMYVCTGMYVCMYVMPYYLTDNNAVRLQRKCNKQQHNISRSLMKYTVNP